MKKIIFAFIFVGFVSGFSVGYKINHGPTFPPNPYCECGKCLWCTCSTQCPIPQVRRVK